MQGAVCRGEPVGPARGGHQDGRRGLALRPVSGRGRRLVRTQAVALDTLQKRVPRLPAAGARVSRIAGMIAQLTDMGMDV